MKTTEVSLFLAGFGLGAAVALLYAPKSGSDLRGAINDGIAKGQDAVTGSANRVVDEVGNAINRRRAVVEHTVAEAVSAFDDAREVFLKS